MYIREARYSYLIHHLEHIMQWNYERAPIDYVSDIVNLSNSDHGKYSSICVFCIDYTEYIHLANLKLWDGL